MKKFLVVISAVLGVVLLTSAISSVIWMVFDLEPAKSFIAGFVVLIFIILAIDYLLMVRAFMRFREEWRRWDK